MITKPKVRKEAYEEFKPPNRLALLKARLEFKQNLPNPNDEVKMHITILKALEKFFEDDAFIIIDCLNGLADGVGQG